MEDAVAALRFSINTLTMKGSRRVTLKAIHVCTHQLNHKSFLKVLCVETRKMSCRTRLVGCLFSLLVFQVALKPLQA